MKVHEALGAVMKSVPVVKKEDRNTSQNFSFRGIDAVLSAVGPALRQHGVIALPQVVEHSAEIVLVGRNQTPMQSVVLLVRYSFTGPEGDVLETIVPGQAYDSGDKGYSKAMSVAFRTALIQALALPTDERDADADTYERASAQSTATERARTATQHNSEATEPPPTPADEARDELLVVVGELKLDPGDVAQLYLTENKVRLQNETREGKIREFADRLEAKR